MVSLTPTPKYIFTKQLEAFPLSEMTANFVVDIECFGVKQVSHVSTNTLLNFHHQIEW